MKALLQRVSHARVSVDNRETGAIRQGYLVLLGVAPGDTEETCRAVARKVLNLRIFHDENQRMNRSIMDVSGSVLLVSQFTLYADTTRGNRPGFSGSAPRETAEHLYRFFGECLAEHVPVEWGVFGARMEVELCNSGPVTILLDSADFSEGARNGS